MATDPTPTDAPLPRRLAWFAPWTWFAAWKPWKQWTLLVGVVLVGYVLSPVPISLMLELSGGLGAAHPLLSVVYFPLELAFNNSDTVHWFYTTQREWLESLVRRFANG